MIAFLAGLANHLKKSIAPCLMYFTLFLLLNFYLSNNKNAALYTFAMHIYIYYTYVIEYMGALTIYYDPEKIEKNI